MSENFGSMKYHRSVWLLHLAHDKLFEYDIVCTCDI